MIEESRKYKKFQTAATQVRKKFCLALLAVEKLTEPDRTKKMLEIIKNSKSPESIAAYVLSCFNK